MNEASLRRQVLAYLAGHHVMTLATTGPAGVWAAAVFYVNDGFRFYFLSAGHTRHALNISENPRVAATIQTDYKDWQQIQGIQLEGEVQQLSIRTAAQALAIYQQKFAFLRQPAPPIRAALAKVNWYCLRPYRLFFVDNTKGFGHRDELKDLS